jgi:hypothetical protein
LLPAALTVPMSGSMVTVAAQVVCHSSVVLSPALISAGLRAKVRITGSGTVVFVTTVVSGVAVLRVEGRESLILLQEGAASTRVRAPGASEKTSTRAIPAIQNL